jgi:hypothetical protein
MVLAVATSVDASATGDAALRDAQVPDVSIMTPREFVERFLKGSPAND